MNSIAQEKPPVNHTGKDILEEETLSLSEKETLEKVVGALARSNVVRDATDGEQAQYLQPNMSEGLDETAIAFPSGKSISFRDLTKAIVNEASGFKVGKTIIELYFQTPVKISCNLELLKASVLRYANERVPTGDFLRAVLENNLWIAMRRADSDSQRNLLAICDYVCDAIPSNIWGSPEAVRAHLHPKIF